MSLKAVCTLLVVGWAAATSADVVNRMGQQYPDRAGGYAYMDRGDLSFADEVVAFSPGIPVPAGDAIEPGKALGKPDFRLEGDSSYLTLGCGGEVVLKFETDVSPDGRDAEVVIFEVGDAAEPFSVAVSADGKAWYNLGVAEGGRADMSISPGAPEQVYAYVKLRDMEARCEGPYPGADIDSVGLRARQAGSGGASAEPAEPLTETLDARVLFDFDRDELKPAGRMALDRFSARLSGAGGYGLSVVGHADSTGGDGYNMALSSRRAASVARYLGETLKPDRPSIQAVGRGESEPAYSNDDAHGRAGNRRVEITVLSPPGE